MECLVQYLDNLEDLFYAAALKAERARQILKLIAFFLLSATLQCLGVMLALAHPPLALGVVALLVVGALHRAVVSGGASAAVASA